MLPRLLRLNTSSFKEIIEKGRFSNGKFFLFRYINGEGEGSSRFAISVPKKVSKSAVDRNKIRRKVYPIVRNLIKKIKSGYKVVILVKPGIEKLSQEEIIKEIEADFVKSGFLK